MSYRLSGEIIGAEELKKAFDKAPSTVNAMLKIAINRTAYKVEERAKANAPHAFGNLAGSITTEPASGNGLSMKATVGTNMKYAEAMEKGARPHFPPYKKMEAWAKLRFGDPKVAFLVARSISKKGIKGRFYFKKAMEDSRPDFTENLREALATIIGVLSR